MDTEREAPVTNRMIDAMSQEELLAFTRKHAGLLGERFPKRMEQFYCPQILDEPHLVRRLCSFGVEEFTQLVLEQSRRDYEAGGRWAAVLLSRGGRLPEEVLRKQESVMPDSLTSVSELKSGFTLENDRPLDSALFLEESQKARQLWTEQYSRYLTQRTRSGQLSQALKLREKWLDMPQAESAEAFYGLNWKPVDVMLAYLIGSASNYDMPVDPDCAAEAARKDPEMAVELLDPDSYPRYFDGQFHPSYFVDMAKIWTEFLYLFCGWTDTAPLERGHRLKKVSAHYRQTLERRAEPDWERLTLEAELRKVGLLPRETPPDWSGPKLAKLQRLTLTKAMVCRYLWRWSDLLAALQLAEGKEVLTALLWGVYEGDQLITALLLDAEGTAWGENGQPAVLPDQAQVGLVVPAELSKEQLTLWKKRLKAAGGKPLVRQLTLPVQPPDFADFQGAVTKHITIYTTAGKWGLDMGALSSHCRADLLDPLHGFGARVMFDTVWNGSEYNSDEVMLLGVEFYRLEGLPFGDHLPRRAAVPPETLPARFVSLAGAAFRQLAGMK